MRRRSVWLAIVVVAILASGAGWWVASPWWTLKSMRDAARAGNSERLASYIDFPRVRADLRDQLIQQMDRNSSPSGLERFISHRAAPMLVNPVLHAVVSPDSLEIALDVAPKKAGSVGASNQTCGMNREDLNHFRVRCARLPVGQADLSFERQGFRWKLVGIDLPNDFAATIL